MQMLEALRVRRSVRTYKSDPVDETVLAEVLGSVGDLPQLSDQKIRLEAYSAEVLEPAMTGLVGSYGKILNPPMYLVGIVEHGEHDQECLGFVMERAIIECTRKTLGTCWIGGFFKRSKMEGLVKLSPDERIVAVTPVGTAAKRRFIERSMRTVGGLDQRQPLSERVFADRWEQPADSVLAANAKLKELFEIARWVPSASNKQPCHYIIEKDRISLFVRQSLIGKYPKWAMSDRAEDLNFQGVDAGIAMCHVHLAAKELDIPGQWTFDFDGPEFVGRCALPADARPIAVFNFQ
jgi:nitroreductase